MAPTVRRRLIAACGLALSAAFGGLVWWGLAHLDASTVARHVDGFGRAGPVLLGALLALQCVIAPIPSEPMMMTAGFLYGPQGGFWVSWSGVVVGALLCFGLARRLGRPFAERFVRAEHLDAADGWVRARGDLATLGTMLALRVAVFGSFDVLSYACGLVSIRVAPFLIATAVGAVPKVFAFTYTGANLAARPPWTDALTIGGTVGVVLLAPWIVRRARAFERR